MRAAFLAAGPSFPSLRLPFEVPASISPALAGILVGAASGVFLFGIVLLVMMRTSRKSVGARAANGRRVVEVVHVPPYATGPREVMPASVPTPAGATLILPQKPALVPTPDPLAQAGETPAGPQLDALEPHPLGVIKGASLADFEVDDSPTEIAETLFDEPPRPLQRGATPRIRPIAPAPPRFSRASSA